MESHLETRRAAALASEHELIRTSLVRGEQQRAALRSSTARAMDAAPASSDVLAELGRAVAHSNDDALKRAFDLATKEYYATEPVEVEDDDLEPVEVGDEDLEDDPQSREHCARGRARNPVGDRGRARDAREHAQQGRERDLQQYYDACQKPAARTARATDAAPVGNLLARRRAQATTERSRIQRPGESNNYNPIHTDPTSRAMDAQLGGLRVAQRESGESDLEFYERCAAECAGLA